MMTSGERKPISVLFLCTGNSARSIMAEAILNREGRGKFQAYSAGSHPKGQVHPSALELLRRLNFSVAGLRSKSWDEYARPDAPRIDIVVTVCDNAAGESCPIWPGHPLRTHWSIPDPAATTGTEEAVRSAFADAFRMLSDRISAFVSLPRLDRESLQHRLESIARSADAGRAPGT
jgi:protein-tyrosine-phosphatase